MMHYFLCSGGPDAVSIKARLYMLRQNCVFTSGGICGSRSAIRCVRGVKRRHTIFHAYVGLVRIPKKKCTGTCYVEFVFLHPVGFVGHVVHSGASWVRNADPLFSLLG
jgi:hypothetical protein